jgi:hypothetical protein
MSLLVAQSGHCHRAERRPLLGVKRTLLGHCGMSAYDPNRPIREADILLTCELPSQVLESGRYDPHGPRNVHGQYKTFFGVCPAPGLVAVGR